MKNMARVAVRHVAEVFDCSAVVLLPDVNGKLRYPLEQPIEGSFAHADLSIAQWVVDHGRRAGLGSDTLPAASALYVPLSDDRQRLGVLAVLPVNRRRILLPEQRHLLETFAGQLGLAMERAQLAEIAESARVAAETESLRNTLLASISHDLRTPLAIMAGASSTLVEAADKLAPQERQALAESIFEQSRDMAERVTKVLQMTRLETGAIQIDRDWTSVGEVASSALSRMSERLASHRLIVELPDDLPLVKVDAVLVEQALGNLLENAAKHTPAGTVVRLYAQQRTNDLVVSVEDYSGGPSDVDVERIFQKFAHGAIETTAGGVGLGLAICRAIVRLHGGNAWAERVPAGGMVFRFSLPIEQPPGVVERSPGSDDGLAPDYPHR